MIVYKVVEMTHFCDFANNKREDIGQYTVETEEITDPVSLILMGVRMSERYVKECVFFDEHSANKAALELTIKKLNDANKRLKEK